MKALTNPRRLVAALAVAAAGLLLTGCAASHPNQNTFAAGVDPGLGPIVIGSDGSAESRVVAALYEQLLVAAGKQARIAATPYGTSADAAEAVVSGTLSLAPAYETALLRAFPGGQHLAGNTAATLSMALPVGIDALTSAAAQRGVVLAVTGATAKRYSLRTIADLARLPGGVALGGAAAQDPDAPSATALAKTYGVATASGTGATTVLVLRGTDPTIAADGLTVLSDPAGVIPPEHVLPLVNADYADKATRTALAGLDSALTTGQLATLAAEVSGGESPDKAASAWLRVHVSAH